MSDKEEVISSQPYSDEEIVSELNVIDNTEQFRIEVDQGFEDALNEMERLKKELSSSEGDNLIDQCKKTVVDSITSQFGLEFVLKNKDGGNVTTIHNAKKKIYAREEDEYNRSTYERGKNSEGKSFAGSGKSSVGSEFTREQFDTHGKLTDAYTGKTIKGSDSSPDHIESVSTFHKEGGYMLNDTQKADFATDKGNLASTERSINQSMKDNDKEEWAAKKSNGRNITNEERYDIDEKKLKEKVEQGKEAAQKHLPSTMQKTTYYAKHAIKTGAADAGKMAAYSAIGIVLKEFVQVTFEAIKETFANRGKESLKEIFLRFKEKMKKLIESLKEKWKDILKGSIEGGVTAFFSNLLVLVINLFATTLKKIVMLIRAGFVSLVKAIKIIANPPEGMNKDDALFEASKIMTAGLIGAVSLGLSATIEKFLQAIPGLQPIMFFPIPFLAGRTVSDVLAVTLSALLGGILTTIVIYFMDKIRKEGKQCKLQIQLMYQSGLVVEYANVQSWFVLKDAYGFFNAAVEAANNATVEAKADIEEGFGKVKEASNDFQDAIKRLKSLNNK